MRLAKDFECCPLGEIYPRVIKAREECPPELEASARELGLLADESGGGGQNDGSGDDDQTDGGDGGAPNADQGDGAAAGEPPPEGLSAPRIVHPPRRKS